MTVIDVDATAILRMLGDKALSSAELVTETIAHIGKHDEKINAVVVKDFERAGADARRADALRRASSKAPLLGLPVTIKESFDVEGLPTNWGGPDVLNDARQENAVAVGRLVSDGAVILGKTNVPTFLDGLGTNNPIYGRTSNPLNESWSPGGSSGGSAAAVRSGQSFLDLGSDLSGSIRHPAALCGVFGHSPSLGLVPARGHSLFGNSAPLDMSTPGPLARSARDLELAMRTIAGPDSDLGCSFAIAKMQARHDALSAFRVLLLPSHPLVATEPAISEAVETFGRSLANLGVHVVNAEGIVPDLRESSLNYARQLGAALSVGQNEASRHEKSAALAALGDDVGSIGGQILRGTLCTHSEWLADFETRRRLRWKWTEIFKDFDAVICPAAPMSILTHAEAEAEQVLIGGNPTPSDDLIVWATLSKSADLPATVIPYLSDHTAGPIGLQIIGPFMEDMTTIHLAIHAGQAGISPGYVPIAGG